MSAPQQSKSRNLDKVMLRLPDGVRESLKASARVAGRSLNAEIVYRLEAYQKEPAAFVDRQGNVSVIDGSPLPDMLRRLAPTPVGQPLIALYVAGAA